MHDKSIGRTTVSQLMQIFVTHSLEVAAKIRVLVEVEKFVIYKDKTHKSYLKSSMTLKWEITKVPDIHISGFIKADSKGREKTFRNQLMSSVTVFDNRACSVESRGLIINFTTHL